MSTLSIIPSHDLPEFAALPDACRKEVREWLNIIAELLHAPRIGSAIQVAARRVGKSPQSVRRYYDQFRATGDWRVFVNRAKYQPTAANLPAAFVDYWKALCERNNRKCKPAYRELIRTWRRGEIPPGYSDLPMPSVNGIPDGWSYRNLMRYKPTKFELTAARIGRTAAADFRPLVFTTRVGLLTGQFYLFDDIWHDHKIHVPGQRQARRPLEFHALDLASANKFAWGITAQLENEVTGKMEHLKEAQMRFLVASILSTTGFHPNGCTLVVEHGTAAITSEMEQMLFDLSGGLIKVARSGIQNAASFAGQYGGRGKGNFRFKAALESLGNLIHNEMAFLPGQTGSNSRLNAPEELHGRERHHDALVNAMLALPPERAQLIRLPFIDLETFKLIAAEIYRRINDRTDHELEGWEESGHVTGEYRFDISQPWLPASAILALPAPQQESITSWINSQPDLTRVRRMSPSEVFAAGSSKLLRFTPAQTALLIGKDLGVERKVRSSLFEFEDRESGPGIHRYLARIGTEALKEGERYHTVLNPMDTSALHIFDAKGRYLGQCERWDSISHADIDALHRQCGKAAAIEKEMLYPVARRGAELTRRRIEDARHNAAVLGGKPITEEEKAEARISKHAATFGRHLQHSQQSQPASPAPSTPEVDDAEDWSSPATQETPTTPHEQW